MGNAKRELDLVLERIPGRFALCRLNPQEIPPWALSAPGLVSITRTDEELSILALQDAVPAHAIADGDWMALRVAGVLDLQATGILALLTRSLADARVPVFVISTHDTDILLVKAAQWSRAAEALSAVADTSALA